MEHIRQVYIAWLSNTRLVLVLSGLLLAAGIGGFGLRSGFIVRGDVGDVEVWGSLAFGLLMAALLVLIYTGWQFDDLPGRTITIAVPAALVGLLINALFGRAMNGGWLPIWGGLLLVTFAATGYAAWRVQARFALVTLVLLVYGMAVTAVLFAALGRPISAPILLGVVAIGGYTFSLACYVLDRIRENLSPARRETYTQTVISSFLASLRPALLWVIALILMAIPLILIGTGPIRSLGLLMLIGTLVGAYATLILPVPLLLTWPGQTKTESTGRREVGRRR